MSNQFPPSPQQPGHPQQGPQGGYPPQGHYPPPPQQKKSHTLRNVLLGLLAAFVLLIGGCAALFGAASTEFTSNTDGTAASREAEDQAEKALPKSESKPKGPKLTAEQEQAVGSAEQYLDISAFSKKGLIQQLVGGDGYSQKDARRAVNTLQVDYNEQAAKSAKDYLDISNFSKQGLIDQLVGGDSYTREQAEYGVSQTKLG